MSQNSWQQRAADALTALRRDGRAQSGFDPDLTPPDSESAYTIAGMVAARLGWDVVGWKIAATNDRMRKALRTNAPIYGRVFAPRIVPSPARVEHAQQVNPIPEVEYQVRLGANLPPRDAPYTLADIDAAVASLHPGIELAECRFTHDERFPPLPAILADGAGSGTLVCGPAIENWRDQDIANQEVVLYCNGERRRSGTAAEAMEHPLVPLTWLANELSRTRVGLRAGQIISTGTLTGMLRPRAGDTYVADFGPFGTVSATYA
ncbi:MAG: fumarylacetoacetate hydrolase family protein [Pseudomonadota bacterium]